MSEKNRNSDFPIFPGNTVEAVPLNKDGEPIGKKPVTIKVTKRIYPHLQPGGGQTASQRVKQSRLFLRKRAGPQLFGPLVFHLST